MIVISPDDSIEKYLPEQSIRIRAAQYVDILSVLLLICSALGITSGKSAMKDGILLREGEGECGKPVPQQCD